MAQNRRDAYRATDGSLALEIPERDYRQVAEHYREREQAREVVSKRETRGLRVKIRTIALIVAAIAIVLLVLLRQVEVERSIIELDTMRKQLAQQEKLAQDMRLELALATDVETVQRVATETLGMNFPDTESMRQVDLPPIKTGSTPELAHVTLEDEDGEPLTLEGLLENIEERIREIPGR